MKKRLVLVGLLFYLTFSTLSFAEAPNGFPDVAPTHWASAFVNSLKSSDIIGGYPDGSFKPASNVNVNEFIAMTIKALGYRFESMSSDWSKPYIDKAIELGIIEDREFDSYTAQITREQMTSIVVHAIALNEVMPGGTLDQYIKNETKDYYLVSDYYKQAMLDSYKLGIITGFDDKTFRPRDFSNRGQAGAVIAKILNSDLRQPFEKTDIKYTMVPTWINDDFGNDLYVEYALYAPLLNGKQVTEMIEVSELMVKNMYLGKGFIDVGYDQYEKIIGSAGYETKEIRDWFLTLTPYDTMVNLTSYLDLNYSIDFNNYNHIYKPYDLSFTRRASILEKYPDYSSYYIANYGDQLKPLFQYWFGNEFNTAWNLLMSSLDAKGVTNSIDYTINGRTLGLIIGSDVCRFSFSLKK